MTSIVHTTQEFALFKKRLSSLDAALVDLFLQRLDRWRDDDSTVEDLVSELDRTLGHIWFSSNEAHASAGLIIARLRDTVAAIGGMTMNERLDAFDLFDRWDRSSDAERDVLYKKLLAKR